MVLLHSFLLHQFTMKSKANKHLIHMIHIRLINKETYDYQCLKKNELLRNIWFSAIKCRCFLKFLETSITI